MDKDRQRFEEIYTPIGILPPDQYLALVLQVTDGGSSHNACTFCTFYRGLDFSIKLPEAFRSHVAAVIDFSARPWPCAAPSSWPMPMRW